MNLIIYFCFFFFNDPATTEIYTLSLHDALPIWRSPSPPPPSPRLSRNCTDCATISTFERLLPSWASHDDQSSRPSTPTRRPLARWLLRASAWLPNTLTSKKFGLSIQLPPSSFCRPLTATPSLSTAVPDGR